MENLLFLVHRIPYPPNKGDKIRSYHLLKQLIKDYNVYLGTFIDDPFDWQYTKNLNELCADACYRPLYPLRAKMKSLRGIVTGQALSLPYYRDSGLQDWVNRTLKAGAIRKAVIYSSVMAQYVDRSEGLDRFVDFVDVDSDKWRQYASAKASVSRWIYRREADCLLAYEKALAAKSVKSFFVSEQEAGLFKKLAPAVADKVTYINNGVDTALFSPDHAFDSPYPDGCAAVVFTGAMDYWPNVDAVAWFARNIFPAVQARHPQAKFYIVGGKPSREVQELASDSVIVTGRVDDVRPYIAHALLVAAPLRVARGIQNKVLEGMAMGKPIVATGAAMEGIRYSPDLALNVADDAQDMSRQIISLLDEHSSSAFINRNRAFVQEHFSWERNLQPLSLLLQGEAA